MPSNFNNQELTDIKFNGVDVSEAYFNGALVFDANQFVSTWRTTTANETITLPTPTNYTVNWGDGTITTDANSHEYATSGDYEIKISGEIDDFAFVSNGDKLKILDVSNNGGLYIIRGIFYGCENLSTIDNNMKSEDEFLTNIFRNCYEFNSDLSSLDTYNSNSFSSAFDNARLFNQDLSMWNTSKVTSLQSCFYQAYAFNGDISTWDVSKVTSMATAFFGTSSFNGDISNWVTTSLVSCATAFQDAVLFDSDIGGWDVSNVMQMQNMLRNTSFNHPLNLWDTSSVQNMKNLFAFTTAFNQNISSWSFVSVTDMSNFMLLKTENDYDANYLSDLLIKLDQDLVFANMVNVNLGFGTIKYDSTGVTAYNSLVAKGFIIQSGGQL